MQRSSDASVSCPAPGCSYGADGGPAVFRAAKIGRAIRYRDEHLRSAHPGYSPPKGSLMSKVPRLD